MDLKTHIPTILAGFELVKNQVLKTRDGLIIKSLGMRDLVIEINQLRSNPKAQGVAELAFAIRSKDGVHWAVILVLLDKNKKPVLAGNTPIGIKILCHEIDNELSSQFGTQDAILIQ